MDHAIYTALGAAQATLARQSIITTNLVNSSTPGFRAQLSAHRAVHVEGQGLPTRASVVASTPGANMLPGPMDYTGRPLDVALQGEGFLAIQLPDGSEAYTRNGSIQISPNGQMTVQGYPLIGSNGPIDIPPQATITIAADGTISALNAGDAANTIVQIDQLKRVKANNNEVNRGDDGLFHLTPTAQQQRGAILPNDAQIKVMPGVLEGSNVKITNGMVDMIAVARSFEMNMKTIHRLDENEQRANQLLAMN